MPTSLRPAIEGARCAVSSTHYLATTGGFQILAAGGNAADAGVATGLCINVVEPHMAQFGGVSPIIYCPAAGGPVETISGLGRWPRAASIDYYRDNAGGEIPAGIGRSVTPAAPDGWLTALARFGTMTFGQVVGPALHLLRNRPPLYDGQKDLITTFERLIAAERGAGGDRITGLKAARDLVYHGDIAREISAFSHQEGGLLRLEDLESFSVRIEPPCSTPYRGYQVFSCGPWCQGPTFPMALNTLEGFDLRSVGHNSADYLHLLIETVKATFADRHHYFGDPDFVQVPIDGLMSKEYADSRRESIDPGRAAPDMPDAGDPWPHNSEPRSDTGPVPRPVDATTDPAVRPAWPQDTAYCCVVDADGNLFSATPSDAIETGPVGGPVIPGLGFAISARGSQTWLDPVMPSGLEPGKRPRLTPNPALVLKDGRPHIAIGCPGGDAQVQGMLQVFLNMAEFGMAPQEAIDAPRVCSHSFPNSFWPHVSRPGEVVLETRIDEAVRKNLAGRGHLVLEDGDWSTGMSRVSTIRVDESSGMRVAGADPRGPGYALGW
mgnify:FL=1